MSHLEHLRKHYGLLSARGTVTTNVYADEVIVPAVAGKIPIIAVIVVSSDTESDFQFESPSGTDIGPALEAETDFSLNYPIEGARDQAIVMDSTVSGTGAWHALYTYR